MSNEIKRPYDRAARDDVKPIVDEWIRSRETSMDGAAYGAAIQLAAFVAARTTQQATKVDLTDEKIYEIADRVFTTRVDDTEILEFVASIRTTPHPVAGSVLQAPVAWLHTMHMELDQTDIRVELDDENPFGIPGKDYSAEYRVTTAPLYAAPSLTSDVGAVLPPDVRALLTECAGFHGQMVKGNWLSSEAAKLLAVHTTAQCMSDAARDVLAERARQVSEEGFSTARDDGYVDGQLAQAGAAYALAVADHTNHAISSGAALYTRSPDIWPWSEKWWKPTNPRRALVKATALLIAEIERIDRADTIRPAKSHCQNGGDVCLAGNRDGVCCPEDSCDIDDGTRRNPIGQGGEA